MAKSEQSELHRQVGERIKALADAKDLSLNYLADFAGIDRGNLSRVTRAEFSPTLRTLEAIAEVLEVEVRDLIPAAGE